MLIHTYYRSNIADSLTAVNLMGSFIRKRTKFIRKNYCVYEPIPQVIHDSKLIRKMTRDVKGFNEIPYDIPQSYLDNMPPILKKYIPLQWVDDILAENPHLEISMLTEYFRKKLTLSLPYSALYSYLHVYFTYFINEDGVCEYFVYEKKNGIPGDKVFKLDPFYV